MVDVRTDIGHNATIELAADATRQLWVPLGFAHGFCVLSDFADCANKYTAWQDPNADHAVLWNDLDLAIDWPVKALILSERDSMASCLADAPAVPQMSEPP